MWDFFLGTTGVIVGAIGQYARGYKSNSGRTSRAIMSSYSPEISRNFPALKRLCSFAKSAL
ncbi:hypothetical protein ABIA20_005156 [Sinorhizobium fredii]